VSMRDWSGPRLLPSMSARGGALIYEAEALGPDTS
jgi:hypothetical protein